METPRFLDEIVTRVVGLGRSQIARTIDEPWFARGIARAATLLRPTPGNIDENLFCALFSSGYSRGAHAALRLATGVLSDPAIRGWEIEALRLIADGADHAAVLAHLRATTRPADDADGNVVPFGRQRT